LRLAASFFRGIDIAVNKLKTTAIFKRATGEGQRLSPFFFGDVIEVMR